MPDSIEMIEAEIETLMLRMETLTPDAATRLEQLWDRFRRRVVVEKALS